MTSSTTHQLPQHSSLKQRHSTLTGPRVAGGEAETGLTVYTTALWEWPENSPVLDPPEMEGTGNRGGNTVNTPEHKLCRTRTKRITQLPTNPNSTHTQCQLPPSAASLTTRGRARAPRGSLHRRDRLGIKKGMEL